MSAGASDATVAVVGGSGVYALEGLRDCARLDVTSPFGDVSPGLSAGRLDDQRVLFLPRHGEGHRLSPSAIDYRANIDGLKRAGATDILSVSAVGSLRAHLPPGTFVIVDQFIDRTFAREKTFFDEGCVAHVSMAEPTCVRLGDALEEAMRELSIPYQRGGTYLVMEGPQFSTKAESEMYRSWGCSVIGMTNMPEAKLAREAELCYATVAMVTDFDCWHPDHGHVTVAQILETMGSNVQQARALLRAVLPRLAERPHACPAGCDRALDAAIVTPEERRAPEALARLDAVAGRVLR